MREEEDQIGHYVPFVRRVIILMAVLTAIPVVMWTITALVRTYVGPHQAPSFQAVATAPMGVAPAQTAANAAGTASAPGDDGKSAPLDPIVEAKATTTDAAGSVPVADPTTASSPTASAVNATSPNAALANATATTAAPQAGDAPQTALTDPAAGGTPAAPRDGAMQFAAQQPAATNWPPPPPAVDASPPGKPIVGAVPLPRKRPSTVAMAQGSTPMPRERPETAGAGAAAAAPSPLGWLHGIFQPAATTPSENSTGGVDSPH
jgi:hypothetical protein